MRRMLVGGWPLAASFLLLASCSGPVRPTESATLDQFVQALRHQGLTVSRAGEISREVNSFFSVPAQQVRVNNG